MTVEDFGEIIAERVLRRSANGAGFKDVIIRLGKPRPATDAPDFVCPFEVSGIGETKIRCAAGIDAFQSLQLVLRMISALLDHYKHEPQVEMFFLEPGDDLGFPEEQF